jgi:hypothetical protein
VFFKLGVEHSALVTGLLSFFRRVELAMSLLKMVVVRVHMQQTAMIE